MRLMIDHFNLLLISFNCSGLLEEDSLQQESEDSGGCTFASSGVSSDTVINSNCNDISSTSKSKPGSLPASGSGDSAEDESSEDEEPVESVSFFSLVRVFHFISRKFSLS